MPAKELQNLIIVRYVEAIKKVAQRKTNKKMKKKTPIHLKRFIRMKRKAGKQLRQLENLTEEKIKKITERIRLLKEILNTLTNVRSFYLILSKLFLNKK